jgi:hypothetical protein
VGEESSRSKWEQETNKKVSNQAAANLFLITFSLLASLGEREREGSRLKSGHTYLNGDNLNSDMTRDTF